MSVCLELGARKHVARKTRNAVPAGLLKDLQLIFAVGLSVEKLAILRLVAVLVHLIASRQLKS